MTKKALEAKKYGFLKEPVKRELSEHTISTIREKAEEAANSVLYAPFAGEEVPVTDTEREATLSSMLTDMYISYRLKDKLVDRDTAETLDITQANHSDILGVIAALKREVGEQVGLAIARATCSAIDETISKHLGKDKDIAG